MRLLAHLLMKLFVLIVQSSVSYLFEMTIKINAVTTYSHFKFKYCIKLTKINFFTYSKQFFRNSSVQGIQKILFRQLVKLDTCSKNHE
jgi:hypothetical protein